MAVVTRGHTYAVNGQVTNTNLHTLVDGATVTDINRADAKSDTGFITIQTTSPTTPKTGEGWFDTTLGIARIYDGTNFVILGKAEVLTNKSGAQRVAGDVVIISTAADRSFTTTTTAQDPLVCGVVLGTVANDAKGVVLMPGSYAPTIKVTGATTAGQFLATGTTAAKATASATPTRGTFAIAMSADAGGVVSGILLSGTGALSGSADVQAALDNAVTPSSSVPFLTKQGNFGPQVGVFTASGNFTATKTGMHKVTVIGGGGTGATGTAGGVGGGGGGAGATALYWASLVKDTVYVVTVGAAGGNSVFAGPATVTAAAGSNAPAGTGAGGAGGAGTNGTVNVTGGEGDTTGYDAGSDREAGGSGGASSLGGGGAGGKATNTSTANNGVAGSAYGSGGGGGNNGGGTGGAGKAGIVIVEYVG